MDIDEEREAFGRLSAADPDANHFTRHDELHSTVLLPSGSSVVIRHRQRLAETFARDASPERPC
jgi:hypothetical protein